MNGDILSFFTHSIGAGFLLSMGSFEVITDTSMTPFIYEESQKGYYTAKNLQQTFQRNNLPNIGYITITFSADHMLIQRQYGKYDDALSYVGGLFGLVAAFLGFFLLSFNEYRYEIFVGEAFAHKDGVNPKENDFHFLMYLKYTCFDWAKTFGW